MSVIESSAPGDRTITGAWYAVERGVTERYTRVVGQQASPEDAAATPPSLTILPVWDPVGTLVTSVIPPALVPSVVHRSHQLVVHEPLRIGDEVLGTARLLGLEPTVLGTVLTAEATTVDRDDRVRNVQRFTLLVRGATIAPDDVLVAPSAATARAVVERSTPLAVGTLPVPADQPVRYAEASGDYMPIHVDEAVARAAGFPGLVLQGLATLAMVTGRVLDELGRPAIDLRRVGAEFRRAVVPPCDLAYEVYGATDGTPCDTFGVSVKVQGKPVLRDMMLEVNA